ncbi:hypothetical protein Tco_0614023 [Tanacetum coccineum]
MASYMASKPSRVRYGTKSLLEQWRETYVNADYELYDDDIYEGQEIPDNIQSICDNLDIKLVAIRKNAEDVGIQLTLNCSELFLDVLKFSRIPFNPNEYCTLGISPIWIHRG